jgi:hypothetical protein
MTRVFNFKATNPVLWAFVAAIGAAIFLYANHSTIAARFSAAKPVGAESSALHRVPAATGIDSSAPLEW